MTPSPVTVTEGTTLAEIADLMERRHIKRLPVLRGDKIVGMISRANLLQAVASLAHRVPDPTADDDHIRNRIIQTIEKTDWCPSRLNVIVRDGIIHLSGVILDEDARQAAIVAAENVEGVTKVHDHLCWFDTITGTYLNSPEDEELRSASLEIVERVVLPSLLRRPMMSSSVYNADRTTHLRIVAVALMASIAIVGLAISARVNSI